MKTKNPPIPGTRIVPEEEYKRHGLDSPLAGDDFIQLLNKARQGEPVRFLKTKAGTSKVLAKDWDKTVKATGREHWEEVSDPTQDPASYYFENMNRDPIHQAPSPLPKSLPPDVCGTIPHTSKRLTGAEVAKVLLSQANVMELRAKGKSRRLGGHMSFFFKNLAREIGREPSVIAWGESRPNGGICLVLVPAADRKYTVNRCTHCYAPAIPIEEAVLGPCPILVQT